jgi:hypothetical protein
LQVSQLHIHQSWQFVHPWSTLPLLCYKFGQLHVASPTALPQVVPMKDAHNPEMFCFDFDENADEEDLFYVFAADILPSLYDKVDVEVVVKQQVHLDAQQHTNLQETLEGMELLFSGKLG